MSLTSAELIAEVQEAVLGASYSDATVLRFLNRAVLRVAGIVILPELATDGTLTTVPSQAWADLPVDYHRELKRVHSTNGGWEVAVYDSFLELEKKFPLLNYTGSAVEACAVRGTRLYCQPVMTGTDTLTLFYHRLPTAMVNPTTPGPTDQIYPDGLPEHLADDLVINYAARELWKLIEQDDRNQINVTIYEKRFNQALAELVDFAGPPDNDPIYIRDHTRYP